MTYGPVGLGQKPELCVERLPEWVIGVLAILKAGGAFVPLDDAMLPVDLVSRAIVQLAQQPSNAGAVFHLRHQVATELRHETFVSRKPIRHHRFKRPPLHSSAVDSLTDNDVLFYEMQVVLAPQTH